MSRVKHLLRKLHIGADHPHRIPNPSPNSNSNSNSSPSPSPNANPSPSSPSPVSSSSPPNGATPGIESTAGSGVDFNLMEEEYQMQLALAISASDQPQSVREDPEKDQIDAAKRISLGCTAATAMDGCSHARVELLSLRYWTYNAIHYDEKVLDGFYDVYVISSKSVVPGKMPLLADLRALSNPNTVDYEVILVNRSVDPELQLLEDKVCSIYNECGALELGPVFSGLIQKVADIVVHRMGGPVGDADEILKKWKLRSFGLRNNQNSIVLPLGALDVGLSRHRALLFKVLADRVNIPCMLVKGSYYTGTDEGAVNFIKNDDGSEYIIDLMGAPGALIPAEVPSNQLSNTGLIVKSFLDVAESSGYPQIGLEKGTAAQADLHHLDIVSTNGSSMLGQASFVSMQAPKEGRNFFEKNQTERFEYDFGKLVPSLHNSCEHSYGNIINTSQAENMKIDDVSKYVLSASKDPEFAQKLHAVLLESGASPPCNMLSDAYLKDLVKQNLPEDLELQAQWNPEHPLVTTSIHFQIADNVGCSKNNNHFMVESAQNSEKLGINVPDSIFSSPIKTTSERPLHVGGLSDEPVNVKGLDALPFFASNLISGASHENPNYKSSSTYLADSCPRLLDHAIVSNGKRQIEGNMQSFDNSDGIVKEPSVGEKSGAQIVSNKHTKKINQVFSEVAEWEIPWDDLQIGERIGIGSYGEVYRSEWNGTEVAVKKFLDQDFSGDALIQFRSEVEIMLRLRHPNVVLFMGAVTRSPHFSILTEFLPRGSLYKLLHRSNQHLDQRRRLRMALDVAKGMNYLHSSHPPIVHRDLKSPNLLVDKSWAVKVCDFGLSRLKHHTFLSSKSTAGTPEWMAPEVLRNEPANEKCDVYSFGVILWELATMSIPWKGLNPMQVVGAVGFQNRRLEIPDNIDPGVSQIINDCWEREPHMRPSFAQIMSRLRRLQHLIVDKPPSNSPLNNRCIAMKPTPAP